MYTKSIEECEWTEADLWAEIYRLREAVKGPDGFDTWQHAAVDERIKRIKAEKQLSKLSQPLTFAEAEKNAFDTAKNFAPSYFSGEDFKPDTWVVCAVMAGSVENK